ncbi:hypothetical protein GYMLUDRAFT_243214 [Collybiopsis luxurians FD-317 M1]|uniref:Uncharacterized protein n=1 Tax=Collybiopsis luxurians FD-317 M1 TaxID=944289 RepID=A0A0D0C1X1_9AGAR|nr:hypothetical protein GYMLUDRAFT_243214 [Collybiopsis luxurians FD-317 M1]
MFELVALAVLRIYAQANSALAVRHKEKYYQILGGLTTSFAGLTVAINIFNTSLIAYRIWVVRRRIAFRINSSNQLSNLANILVMFATLYTVALMAVIISLNSHQSLLLIFQDVQTPFIGIVFTNVIISVSQDDESRNSSYNAGSQGHPQTPTDMNMQIIIASCSEQVGLSTSKVPTSDSQPDKNSS